MTPLIQLLNGRSLEGPRTEAEWCSLLLQADKALCTPLLRHAKGLPTWVGEQVHLCIAKVAERHRCLIETYREVAAALDAAHVPFVLLKGFTHEVGFGIDPGLRVQNDVDLWCQSDDIMRATDVLLSVGYRSHGGAELSGNHSPPLVKPYSWKWRGDYFDPEMPIAVELHHALWSESNDRVATPGMDDFWQRRTAVNVAGLHVTGLRDVDRLGFAGMHLLRHVLANNLRPGQAKEVADMLAYRGSSDVFWAEWSHLHPRPLRELQTIAFAMAGLWFHQPLPAAVEEIWRTLPEPIHQWFRDYGWSPVLNLEVPNKHALRLHLALLPRWRDRVAVAGRRLIPLRLPRRTEVVGTSYGSHVLRRCHYHALALIAAIWTRARSSAANPPITSATSD